MIAKWEVFYSNLSNSGRDTIRFLSWDSDCKAIPQIPLSQWKAPPHLFSLFTGLCLESVLQCINLFSITWVGTALCPPPAWFQPRQCWSHSSVWLLLSNGCVPGLLSRAEPPPWQWGRGSHRTGWARPYAGHGLDEPAFQHCFTVFHFPFSGSDYISVLYSLCPLSFPAHSMEIIKKKKKEQLCKFLYTMECVKSQEWKWEGIFRTGLFFLPLLSVNSIKRDIRLGFKIF